MPVFILDIALSFLVYAILIFFMKWKFNHFKKSEKKNEDGDGGITVEYPEDPVLDLPPGVTLPLSGQPGPSNPERVRELVQN